MKVILQSVKVGARHAVPLLWSLMDILYPSYCEICGAKLGPGEKHVCAGCLKKIRVNSAPFCWKCARPLGYERAICGECAGKVSYLEKVWSWALYDETLKKCLHIYKYKKRRHIIDSFKTSILDFFDKNCPWGEFDAVTYVPLDRHRLSERGFNQSEIPAAFISARYNIALIEPLEKIRETVPQNKLDRHKRRHNIKNAFVSGGKGFRGKNILIVDDIFTTGATLNECARVLLKNGAKKVYGFTLARGL